MMVLVIDIRLKGAGETDRGEEDRTVMPKLSGL
jgi:hypothetical protein